MQLFSSEHGPPSNVFTVCRQSWQLAATSLMLCAGLVGIPFSLWYLGHLPNWLALILAPFVLMAVRFFLLSFLSILRTSNWTMAIGPDGLWLNLRSYTNYQFDSGKTVVQVPYDEIASVSQHVARRTAQSADGQISWTEVALDFRLGIDTTQLIEAIRAEAKREVQRTAMFGLVTISGRSHHVPVSMPQDRVVRVMWKSRYDRLRPGVKAVLAELSPWLTVVEGDQADSSDWSGLTEDEMKAEVLRLVERGERISAVKLLKARRGVTTSEAKRFIDALHDRVTS